MVYEAREQTELIQNDGRQTPFAGCSHIWRDIGKQFFCLATMAALGLSISAIVLAKREDTRLNKYNGELNSVKNEVQTCYNDSFDRIHKLAKKIDQIDSSLTGLVEETKSSLENKISSVESGMNTRFISIQNQVSDLNTNIDNIQTSFGKFQDSTYEEFSKVWEKFREVEKEIANLPQKCGNVLHHCKRSYVILYSTIVLLLNTLM